MTIAFDPSYVPKSGKATWGVGNYWSGVAGKSKWGIEISSIAAIDIDNQDSIIVKQEAKKNYTFTSIQP